MRSMIATALMAMTLVVSDARAAEAWQTLPEPAPLQALAMSGHVAHDGAQLWFATVGTGSPVLLLHGGLGSSDDWGNQVPALVAARRRVILIDSRGHGRSTRDARPMDYERMESDVVAVLDALGIRRVDVVGWSDGGIVGLIMAMKHPQRVKSVFAFGANMDLHGANPDAMSSPILPLFLEQTKKAYQRLSPTPGEADALAEAMEALWNSQPNYSAADLARISGPRIAIVDGEHEEFVTRAHTLYLARTIPGARLILLRGVSHFAPLQDGPAFNRAMLRFLQSAPTAR